MSQIGNFRDISVTLDVSGNGTIAQNGDRQFLFIQNGSAHDITVNLAGGTAGAAGTAGNVTLKALAASNPLQFDCYAPQNAIKLKGTAADIVCVFEA